MKNHAILLCRGVLIAGFRTCNVSPFLMPRVCYSASDVFLICFPCSRSQEFRFQNGADSVSNRPWRHIEPTASKNELKTSFARVCVCIGLSYLIFLSYLLSQPFFLIVCQYQPSRSLSTRSILRCMGKRSQMPSCHAKRLHDIYGAKSAAVKEPLAQQFLNAVG